MRISIVTPVFNGMPWLPEAVASIADQVGDLDVEHIILDAGSNDGSRAWLDDHRHLGYKTVFEPDRGQTDALVKGFSRATGDIFSWLNADDLLEPRALDTVARAFVHQPEAVIVSGRCLQIDAEGAVIGVIDPPPGPGYRALLHHPTNMAQPATFFRAEAYRAVGGLNTRYDLAMDVDLWFRLARIGPVVLLPRETLARFRLHPAAKSVANLGGAIRQDLAIRLKHGASWRSPAVRVLLIGGWIGPARRRIKRLAGRRTTIS
jgi:glycosyltransferase involved in cell wall biosynthesis